MDREITVTLSPRLLRWTLFYQFRPILFLMAFISSGVIANIVFWVDRGADLSLGSFAPYLFPVLFVVFLIAVIRSAYSKNMAQIREMKSPVVKYRITDEWLYVRSELGSGQNSWGLYKSLQKNAKLWRLVAQSGISHVFPIELLDEELRSFLSDKLPKSPRSSGFPRSSNHLFKTLAFWLLVAVVVMYFLRQGGH